MTSNIYIASTAKPRPLNLEDLRQAMELEIKSATSEERSQIAIDQEKGLEYYRGEPFGQGFEIPGRSQIVMRSMQETIEWILPSLMRMFFGGENVVIYADADEDSYNQGVGRNMTKAVNEYFREELQGFRLFYDWFKACLIDKFTAVKIAVDRTREPSIEDYQQLSEENMAQLLNDPDVEPVHLMEDGTDQDPNTGQPRSTYSMRAKHWKSFTRVRLMGVPPEELLVSPYARSLDDSVFVAQRRIMTKGELFSMGIPWDKVEPLPIDPELSFDPRQVARFRDETTARLTAVQRPDVASQTVWVTEGHIKIDVDGDGFPELRRVLAAGRSHLIILEQDYADINPFAGITAFPMPYKLYGQSLYDILGDLQLIMSVIVRQLMDNIYSMNQQRHVLVEGEIDLDSYLESAPGAPVIAYSNPDAIKPLETPALPPWAFQMLQYFEEVRENRSGVRRMTQEMFSEGRNQTATGIGGMLEAAQQKIDLIARILAEGGVKDFFRKLPRILKRAGVGSQLLKVGTEFVMFDPAQWPDHPRVLVQPGLSPGQTDQRIARQKMLLDLQVQAFGSGWGGYLVTADQVYNSLAKIAVLSGERTPSLYFTDPKGQPPPPPPPNPDAMKVQAEAQQGAARIQLDAEKTIGNQQDQKRTLDLRELDIKLTHERELERIRMEREVRMHEAELRSRDAMAQVQATKDIARAEGDEAA